MGWYEGIQRLNKKIDELEKEVRSLRDEITSLKDEDQIGKAAVRYIVKQSRINGRDCLATDDIGEEL